ncbi:MAG: 1-acyl-sn-glycerol-3-phosphate acyltransferase [Bacteroidota bacterium]
MSERKSFVSKILGGFYKSFGWKIQGEKPNLLKYVIIIAPHTSNWDFFVGWGARNVLGFKPNFLAKKSLFRIPIIGWFLKFIGGVPVDRSKKTKLVDQVVQLFNSKDEFIMTITPEGTRSYSPTWKTGFYRIANQASVPIVKIGFDYVTKTVFVDKPYYTKGNMEKEIEEIKNYFRRFTGKNPEKGVK